MSESSELILFSYRMFGRLPHQEAGYPQSFRLKSPESPLSYPQEPPYVPTVLPTVGTMDYPWMGFPKNPFEVRCVVGEATFQSKSVVSPATPYNPPTSPNSNTLCGSGGGSGRHCQNTWGRWHGGNERRSCRQRGGVKQIMKRINQILPQIPS